MERFVFENNFFETSVLICAASYFEECANKVYQKFKQGNFLICPIVLEETRALYKRRIKIYNSIPQAKNNPKKPIWDFIEEIINKNHVENKNDRRMIEQTFKCILVNLTIEKDTVPSDAEWFDFELETNKVFNHMKNKLCDIEYSFSDYSYYSKHVIKKDNGHPNHPIVLHNFRKEISLEDKDQNDLLILTNATIYAHKKDLFVLFVSNDGIHLKNTNKIYKVIDKIYPIQIEQERKLTVVPLKTFAG